MVPGMFPSVSPDGNSELPDSVPLRNCSSTNVAVIGTDECLSAVSSVMSKLRKTGDSYI